MYMTPFYKACVPCVFLSPLLLLLLVSVHFYVKINCQSLIVFILLSKLHFTAQQCSCECKVNCPTTITLIVIITDVVGTVVE